MEQSPVTKVQRQSNFDILKIIAFIFVVIHHYNNKNIGGALAYSEGVTFVFFSAIESLAIVAVPIFVLITGYFSRYSKTFNLKKIFGLYVMQFSYLAICYLLDVAIFKTEFSVTGFFSVFIPNNYFINFYAVLMLVAPLLNCIFKLNKKTITGLMVTLITLFVLLPTVIDVVFELTDKPLPYGLSFVTMYGTFYGYSIVYFIVLYLIGACIREYDIHIRKLITLPAYVVLTALITLESLKLSAATHYDNVLVLASALSLFLLFKEIKIKEIKPIGFIAKCSLGVFLLHTTRLISYDYFGLFNIQENIEKGFGSAALNMLAVVFSTVAICVVVDILLRLAVTPIKKRLYRTKVLNYNIIEVE